MLPVPEFPYIHVNEMGPGIIADPSAAQADRRFAQKRKTAVRDPEIHGLPLDMVAVFGHPPASFPQQGIRFRGAIPGYDMERMPGRKAHLFGNGKKQIQESGIDGLDISGTMVPEKVINRFQRLRNVGPFGGVCDAEGFAGVGIIKGKMVRCPGSFDGGQKGGRRHARRCRQRGPLTPIF